MGIAALIVGLIGGLFGLFGALTAIGVGGLGSAVGASGAGQVVGLGVAAIFISIYAIVAAALAMRKPKFSGWSMIIVGVAGIIAISAGYMIAGPLLIIAGILALVEARNQARTQTAGTGDQTKKEA